MTTRNKRASTRTAARQKPPVKQKPKPRLRVLKVFVQPLFVLDDGERLPEIPGAVMTIAGDDWQTWAKDIFSKDNLAELCSQIDLESIESK